MQGNFSSGDASEPEVCGGKLRASGPVVATGHFSREIETRNTAMKVGRWALISLVVLSGFLILGVWIAYRVLFGDHPGALFETIERTEVKTPPVNTQAELVDDQLSDRMSVFDPDLIDSRPIGDWQVNTSAAILRIDSPMIRPDFEPQLIRLRASYAEVLQDARVADKILPSANLIDGVGKQFDDGLMAAIELAMFRGDAGASPSVLDVVKRLRAGVEASSAARDYLDAVLQLSGESPSAEADRQARITKWLDQFAAQPMSSPLGFYTWNDELKAVWKTFRALQFPLVDDHEPIARQLAAALNADAQLASDYQAVHGFYGSLSNPTTKLCLSDLISDDRSLGDIAQQKQVDAVVTLLPTSSSRETELFQQLFPLGLPAGSDLMSSLIKAIRSGEVDLAPAADEGWYQHQVYALETLLLTDKNQESAKLVLTANYKRRLLEAFKALITKRRETHMRNLGLSATSEAPLQAGDVSPRLRVEPTASFYLRTARAYAFIETLLVASIGEEKLSQWHGQRAGGERELSIAAELTLMKQRNYGFYLVACEDIGMRPEFAEGEEVDQPACMAAALEWLQSFATDPDLAVDTRVCVPIYIDPQANQTRMWGTVGVRLVKLNAAYLTPPSVRPLDGSGEWEEAERYLLSDSDYYLAVDDFAEFTITGTSPPTREAFRKMCDPFQTKEEFLARYGSR